ncbi:riboflavin synthase [Microbacterium sp. CFH 90308]|uniref:Riboflavin synthase n=1 Tax=Microbacterium salsuginis TaxID=2722803 RepID=A0ABX1KD20_9MICO|nr:riboflavin synthase [Microbacterium sp. CFH 90308]NLP84000.1 riboflavin synthase [Microbacterium sp. CFH 90308]
MFTGIVEEVGRITAVEPSGDGVRVTVEGPKAVSDAAHGDSISVSGVCLTVVDQGTDWFTADVMKQTLDMSTLAGVTPGRAVNLERATAAHGRLGGHIVQGHIDGTGELLEVRPGAQWRVLRIGLPYELAPLVVDKGSISVDGVSLTVSAASPAPAPGAATDGAWFEVSLIPETLAATTLGALEPGDRVNLETDILARHVQRLLSFAAAAAPTEGGSE